MGLLSSIASIFGASNQKSAIKAAGNEQLAYAQKGIDALQGAVDTGTGYLSGQQTANADTIAQILANFAPYQQAGTSALAQQSNLMGLNGLDAQNQSVEALSASPLFQRLLGAGQNAILQNASATGGLRGGNVQHSLADFSSDLLGSTVQNQLANLNSVAGQGFNASQAYGNAGLNGAQLQGGIASALAQLGLNGAGAISGLYGDQGTARAQSILGRSQATQQQYQGIASGIGNIAGAFLGSRS